MQTEIIKNTARKYFPACHHCQKPIKDPDFILHHVPVDQIFHNKYECFKNRSKTLLFQQLEDEFQKVAIQFGLLYQLNKSTWQELRK